MYGAVIDTVCLVHQTSCTRIGACLLYDQDLFRLRLHGLPVAGKAGAFLMYGCALYFNQRNNKRQNGVVVNKTIEPIVLTIPEKRRVVAGQRDRLMIKLGQGLGRVIDDCVSVSTIYRRGLNFIGCVPILFDVFKLKMCFDVTSPFVIYNSAALITHTPASSTVVAFLGCSCCGCRVVNHIFISHL